MWVSGGKLGCGASLPTMSKAMSPITVVYIRKLGLQLQVILSLPSSWLWAHEGYKPVLLHLPSHRF